MKFLIILILMIGGNLLVFGQSGSRKNNQISETEAAIYIPVDQRHKGLSRYDLIPFTDRERGDPDRYRAVNPNFVKRENGRYFYHLTVKSGTPLYDANLKQTGVLTDTSAAIDLADSKTEQSASGKNLKFVAVKNKGYVPASAIEQKPEEIRSGRWFQFPLKSGEHKLYDGTGIERGTLVTGSVRLNYGLQKQIKGENFYYAFSTKMNLRGETVGASGWIKASAIEAGNDPRFDAKFVDKMQMPTGANDRFTRYEITGGEVKEQIGKDAGCAPIYKFGYTGKNGDFVAYKVLPRIPLDGRQSVAATDYLKRSDAVINLGFNPAGVSNDTFRVEGANRPLIFYRSQEKDSTIEIDLFYPKGKDHDGEKTVGKMRFVYGYVQVPDGKRWGWIPLAALKPMEKK